MSGVIYLCMSETINRRTTLAKAPRLGQKVCVPVSAKDLKRVLEAKGTRYAKIYAGCAQVMFAYVDNTRVSGHDSKLGAQPPKWDVEWLTMRKPLLNQLNKLLNEGE